MFPANNFVGCLVWWLFIIVAPLHSLPGMPNAGSKAIVYGTTVGIWFFLGFMLNNKKRWTMNIFSLVCSSLFESGNFFELVHALLVLSGPFYFAATFLPGASLPNFFAGGIMMTLLAAILSVVLSLTRRSYRQY